MTAITVRRLCSTSNPRPSPTLYTNHIYEYMRELSTQKHAENSQSKFNPQPQNAQRNADISVTTFVFRIVTDIYLHGWLEVCHLALLSERQHFRVA